jgi:hypothetical protein
MAQGAEMKNQKQANSGGNAPKKGGAALPILPAMPIRIRLGDCDQVKYTLETKDGEPIFRVHHSGQEDPPQRVFNEDWDAYALRAAFERIATPEEALAFLNGLGCLFRIWRRDPESSDGFIWILPWRELKAWQMIVRILRITEPTDGELGGFFPLTPRQPSRQAELLVYREAGVQDDQVWLAELFSVASKDTYCFLQGLPPQMLIRRDMYLNRADIEEIRATVEKRFPAPESRVPGSRGWQFAQSFAQHRKTDKARGTPELKQKLIAEIFTATPLDAILATVYVDKLRGRDLQVCALRDCDVTFERSSDSRKTYCSQAHAHLASVRHKREEARKAKPAKARKAS